VEHLNIYFDTTIPIKQNHIDINGTKENVPVINVNEVRDAKIIHPTKKVIHSLFIIFLFYSL